MWIAHRHVVATVFVLGFVASAAHAEELATGAADGIAPERALSLAEAYRLAVKDNPTLEGMRARVDAARAATRRVWGQLKPSASLDGSLTLNDPKVEIDTSAFSGGSTPGQTIVIQRRYQLGYALQANVPLFVGPAYQQLGVAKKGQRAAELRFVRSRQDFLLQVADAYYTALSSGEVVAALEEKVTVDRQNLEVARARFEVGRTVRSDALRAELVLVQDEQSLRQQRNAFEAAKQQVALLIGVDEPISVSRPPEPSSPPSDAKAQLGMTLERRADVAAMTLDIAAARQSRKAVWWSFLPTVALSFLYRWQDAAGFANRKDSIAVVGSLSIPIYEGGVRYADLLSTQASIRQSQAAKAELARQIAINVVQLRAQLTSAEAGLVSAEKALSLAEVTLDEMTARYEAGTATQLDVLDATQRKLEARIDLTRSRYGRDMARLALAHAGGTFDPVSSAARGRR